MEERDNSGVMAVAIGLVLILLLLGGGAGTLFFVRSHRIALSTQAERALLAEAQARLDAERARADAIAAAGGLASSPDSTSAPVKGEAIRTAVESILSDQKDAWNRGDLDEFMKHYWNSDDLTFSAEGKTTRGWDATMTRYRERYPTREKMGRLQLNGLEITPLGDGAALVLGQWKVERAESDSLAGNFSLVVRKFDDRWLIVHDHTSRTRD